MERSLPLLWDDGPWTLGGHEPANATAGDHGWGVTVFVEPSSTDQVFEYGLIRGSVDGSDGSWIWLGTNGLFAVVANATDGLTANGMEIEPFGDRDLRLRIDTNALDAGLMTWTPGDPVAIRSSAWGWAEIDLADDGLLGDESAAETSRPGASKRARHSFAELRSPVTRPKYRTNIPA